MRLSLRYRLLLPLAMLLGGDAAATAWAAFTAARQTERRLAQQQWDIAQTLDQPTSGFPLNRPVLDQLKGFSGAEFMFIPANPVAGEPAATFPEPQPPPPDVPRAELTAARNLALGPSVRIGNREYRCLRVAIREEHPTRRGDLYIFYPEELRRSAVEDAVRPLILLGGTGGLVAVALALVFGTRLVRRIGDIDARTRLIADGDFRPMPLPTADDELRDLCVAVNDMARRLTDLQAELQQSERLKVLGQFSGGLAHQLRNAATGARLAVELFLAENPTADPEPLCVALRQLARIEANLRQFLVLGKPPTSEKRLCDLRQTVEQAVSLLRPQTQHAQTTLVFKPSAESCVLLGDPESLSHLVGNVIGNALEAAGPGGEVSVHLAALDNWARIEVTDTGCGPPTEIAARLFDPFVTGKKEGVGLGLAVARQAAEAHGGRITWERRDGRTVFIIELPCCEPATGSG